MQEPRIQELSVKAAVLNERLDHLDDCVDELKVELFGGGGKPGEIPVIKTRLDTIERTIYRAAGALSVIVIVSGFLSGNGALSLARFLEFIYHK